MTTDTTKDNTIDLVKVKESILDQGKEEAIKETQDLLEKAIASAKELLADEENTKGIFMMSFNTEGDPKMVWGGDIDYIKVLGSLEIAKFDIGTRLMMQTYQDTAETSS